MFNFFKRRAPITKKKPDAPIYLTNTLSGKKEEFAPPQIGPVKMYNCGPTVYDTQHIGNLSAFVFANLLRNMLEYNGLEVKQVINITDVGHLTSDSDEGEDKMKSALKREGKEATLENMDALAQKYTDIFWKDLEKLNIDTAKIEFPRASKYIDAQIAFIQTLHDKGYTYQIKDGVYFDTSLLKNYGELGNIDVEKQKEGARTTVNKEKRHPSDFALWKFSKGIGWESPWGNGFPGWHIECSAMIRSTLGEQIDIHTGGIEHIGVHHNNEIAQSESATGKKPLSRFWLHRAHIQLDGQKMAKSEGSVVYLSDIIEKEYSPLTFRYWLLQGHYRTPMNFTWDALDAASTALTRLWNIRAKLPRETNEEPDITWQKQFREKINDDVDTAGALAVLWDMTKDDTLEPGVFLATLLDFDKVFMIGLGDMHESPKPESLEVEDLPKEIQKLLENREKARKNKEWEKADALRSEIKSLGYEIVDTDNGVKITKIT
ncbi:cysteine--tRNA ligase [Candidatus Kaiserbacteria bacterium CG10_big_fil_rev_8_21_14_0_10_43_70]|uniref:Cysteine--tRNA ligase n=1 Tax=Candidatus Kaiserbacteria bacterium CG10_big_fil_rev_8_21_14_0_10_43_70 TaxID=1974605 RepID=A0A2H0UIW5_9BACT|nr:MAG: cysteine--tRNA ligase [Candidatus Kaiserbacteria bacterium CG10_big_fil_rev_8_21_14_0_10_43_70]